MLKIKIIEFIKILLRLFPSIAYFPKIINNLKLQIEEEKENMLLFSELCSHMPELKKEIKVVSGPFSGMKYAQLRSYGSKIYPKILGTYESEIQDFFYKKMHLYNRLVDIGAAEGYYAVGAAYSNPDLNVVAYEASNKAVNFLKSNAQANNVLERVEVRAEFTPRDINNNTFDRHTLILCDVEGYEDSIFSIDTIEHFKESSLIIETHDMCVPGITKKLIGLFNNTHSIQVVCNEPFRIKAKKFYEANESLSEFPADLLFNLANENRDNTQEWLILFPNDS